MKVREIINPANLLSSVRILLAPLFVYFLSVGNNSTAFVLYVIAWISDGLDGFVARWLNYQTTVGTYLDPIADKLFLLTTFVALGIYNYVPIWFVAIIVLRDVITGGGTLILLPIVGFIDVKPLPEGKAATFFLLTTAFVVLLVERAGKNQLQWYEWTLIIISSILTLVAAVRYFIKGINILREHLKKGPAE